MTYSGNSLIMQAIKTIDKNEIFVTGVNGSEDFDLAL
jgi:hypothetical protein